MQNNLKAQFTLKVIDSEITDSAATEQQVQCALLGCSHSHSHSLLDGTSVD